MKSGTVFYFDDLYSFHLHPNMGQVRAIREYDGAEGFLSPLREHDCAGRTFMYSALERDGIRDQSLSGAGTTQAGS